MAAYYNEIEPYAAQWLRNLIKAGHIPDGEVDERSIVDVRPDDLFGFDHVHFFAGLGGWPCALRLAEWPDDRPVWTGSCPCQPFSAAGKGIGVADERHLWPVFFRLIRECRPAVVMGEQVAGKAGYGWLDGVRSDLEGESYACRAVDIPACAVDAPHIRQRLYWVAVDNAMRRRHGNAHEKIRAGRLGAEFSGELGGKGMDDATGARRGDAGCGALEPARDETRRSGFERRGGNGGDMADAARICEREPNDDLRAVARKDARLGAGGRGKRHSAWSDAEWLTGADGKARRVKPGICLLADGISARASKLRALGNAIVPQAAEQVIRAFMETCA